jgi:formate--tetrahydrofolate ligase
LVATIRALKSHGGIDKDHLNEPNEAALRQGLTNLTQHIQNLQTVYQVPLVVALNKFSLDTESEIEIVKQTCVALGVDAIESTVWENGSRGGVELAKAVAELTQTSSTQDRFAYDLNLSITNKILAIAQKIYHADQVKYSDLAQSQIQRLEKLGFSNLPICIAKTQYSFSDNPKLLGAPQNFNITIQSVQVSAGAGFIVAIAGNIMTMPGLPKVPAAENIDVTDDGQIIGIF